MWKSVKAIAILIISQYIFVLPILLLSWATGSNEATALIIGLLLAWLAVIIYFCIFDKIQISSSEFNERPLPTLALCISIVPFLIVISLLLNVRLELPNIKNIPFEEMPLPLLLLAGGVFCPIAEEMVFRGAVLGSLLKWRKLENKPWLAILLSALLFCIVHMNPAQVPTTLLLGLVAGWLYFKTGSLIPGIIIHVLNNTAVFMTATILEESNMESALVEWEPSFALQIVLLFIFLSSFLLLLHFLVKTVNRDMPAKSIWSSTDPNIGNDKTTFRKIDIGSWSVVAGAVLIFAVFGRHLDIDEVIHSFGNFHEGLAFVEKDGKVGFIDKDGNYAIPCEYDSVFARGFNEGLCCVEENGHWGYIDKDGKVVIPLDYDKTGMFSEGLAPVCKDGKYGYIDNKGNVVLPFNFDWAESFKDGKATVSVDARYGVIDKSGKEIVPFEYDDIYPFHDGLALVSDNGNYGFVDSDGLLVIPTIYSHAGVFKNGSSIVSKNGKYGSIDSIGAVVIPLQYDDLRQFGDSLYLAGASDGFQLIDRDNKVVAPFGYQSVLWFRDGLAMVDSNHQCSCLVNLQGEIQQEFDYSLMSVLNEGLAIARKDGKEGFVNSSGEVIIPFIYDKVEPFNDGLARACRGRHRYFIDKKGKIVIKLK